MTPKRDVFVLRVTPGQGDFTGFDGDTVAVVEMTPTLARIIQRRIALLREVKANDPQVLELSFWDSNASYYEDLDTDRGPLTQFQLEAIQEKEWDAFEDNAFEGEEYASIEVPQMVVTAEGVHWTVMPKHSDVYAVTGTISLKEIQKFIPKPNAKRRKAA